MCFTGDGRKVADISLTLTVGCDWLADFAFLLVLTLNLVQYLDGR